MAKVEDWHQGILAGTSRFGVVAGPDGEREYIPSPAEWREVRESLGLGDMATGADAAEAIRAMRAALVELGAPVMSAPETVEVRILVRVDSMTSAEGHVSTDYLAAGAGWSADGKTWFTDEARAMISRDRSGPSYPELRGEHFGPEWTYVTARVPVPARPSEVKGVAEVPS